jgi:hypothetical protein
MPEIRRTTSDGRDQLKAEKRSVAAYDAAQSQAAGDTCRKLRAEIERTLPKAAAKVWHGHPVWFVGETPVVGYRARAKDGGVVLLFWNGQALDAALEPVGKFKAAQAVYADASDIEVPALRRRLKLAGTKLWDVNDVRKERSRAQARR